MIQYDREKRKSSGNGQSSPCEKCRGKQEASCVRKQTIKQTGAEKAKRLEKTKEIDIPCRCRNLSDVDCVRRHGDVCEDEDEKNPVL
jgi:hypothetical protein